MILVTICLHLRLTITNVDKVFVIAQMVLALRESNAHRMVMIDALHVIALIICQATFVCIRSAIAIMAQERLEVIVLQMDLIGALVAIPATICRRRHLIIINAGSIPAIAMMEQ